MCEAHGWGAPLRSMTNLSGEQVIETLKRDLEKVWTKLKKVAIPSSDTRNELRNWSRLQKNDSAARDVPVTFSSTPRKRFLVICIPHLLINACATRNRDLWGPLFLCLLLAILLSIDESGLPTEKDVSLCVCLSVCVCVCACTCVRVCTITAVLAKSSCLCLTRPPLLCVCVSASLLLFPHAFLEIERCCICFFHSLIYIHVSIHPQQTQTTAHIHAYAKKKIN